MMSLRATRSCAPIALGRIPQFGSHEWFTLGIIPRATRNDRRRSEKREGGGGRVRNRCDPPAPSHGVERTRWRTLLLPCCLSLAVRIRHPSSPASCASVQSLREHGSTARRGPP